MYLWSCTEIPVWQLLLSFSRYFDDFLSISCSLTVYYEEIFRAVRYYCVLVLIDMHGFDMHEFM